MNFNTIADWSKWLEKNFTNEIMIPTLPVIIRLDGNNFHNWTKGLKRPFDKNFRKLMTETTKFLVQETNAVIGYTQSDEITLILYSNNRQSSIYHDGKKQKILSKLTAKCVTFFNEKRKELLPNHNKLAVFDCRIYQTPTLQDACVQLLWRENDATKNSVSMLGQSLFSHNELMYFNTTELIDVIRIEKGIDWNNLPTEDKRGVYVKRIKTSEPFSEEEIKTLPTKHQIHKNPDLVTERSVIKKIEYPPLKDLKNMVGVIFFDEKPNIEFNPLFMPDFTESDIDKLYKFDNEVDLDNLKKCGWEYAKSWIDELKKDKKDWANAFYNLVKKIK